MTLCVLDNADPKSINQSPFTHLVRQKVFSPTDYARLADEFPEMEVILGDRKIPGSNYAARLPASKALAHPRISPLWKEFIRHHTSTDHWREIVELFGQSLLNTFPDIEKLVGKRMADWTAAPRDAEGEADIRLDCQIVINTPVSEPISVRPAHIDKRTTIYSGLFYMRHPDDLSSGGDLELFSWKRQPRFLETRACVPSDIKKESVVSYSANCYTCFINSPLAVHGVSVRGLSPLPRRYINFIAEMPRPAFRYEKIGKWGHAWMRLRGVDYLPRDVGGDRY